MRRASRRRRSTIFTIPGFSNPDVEPETSKNFEGGVYWNGNLPRRPRRASRDRLSQPGVAAHRLPVRRRLQLRAAQRQPRDAARRDAGTRSARRRRRHRRCVARPPVARGRCHWQPAAAPCAPARRGHCRVSRRPGAARRGAGRLVVALRGPCEPREDGRLRRSSISPPNGWCCRAGRSSRARTTCSTRTTSSPRASAPAARRCSPACAPCCDDANGTNWPMTARPAVAGIRAATSAGCARHRIALCGAAARGGRRSKPSTTPGRR